MENKSSTDNENPDVKENNKEVNRGLKRCHEEEESKTKLPQELLKMFKPLCCELCGVLAPNTLMAYTHYKGKPHMKKINAYMKQYHNIDTTDIFKKKKDDFEPIKCHVCDIEINSNIVYQQHLAGKQHVKNLKKSNIFPPITKIEVTTSDNPEIEKSSEEKQPDMLINSMTSYCEVCHIYTNTEKQMDHHKTGVKHMKKLSQVEIQEKETD